MSGSEKLRKVASGVCLVVAPLALLVGLLLHPEESMNAAEQLGIIAADPSRWALAHYIIAAAAMVLAGAVLGLAHLTHERRPAQAIVGGTMGVVGAMALFTVAFTEATFGAQMGRAGADGAVLDTFSAVWAMPASYVIQFGTVLGPLGMVVLGSGLYSVAVAPRWTAVALMAGGLCIAIGAPITMITLITVGAALWVVAMAPIGFMVFGESDEEWMHTPARAVA